jgi:uncharacterized protein involved in type VI secretion and phage assembly
MTQRGRAGFPDGDLFRSLNMAKLTDFLGRPHSGIVPSAVVGLVTDNVDPDELGRVKVKFPTLHEEPQSFWLRVAAPNAGKERGFYALPEKDDEVLVLFMQGSQDVGLIIGQFWNGKDKPPKEAKDGMPKPADTDSGGAWSTAKFAAGSTGIDKNDRRLWRSRSGHLFVFDDTSGSESVTVWDKSHKLSLAFDSAASLITLANTGGDIHIRAKENVFIESGKDTKFKQGQHWICEAAQDIKFKAGMNWKAEAGQNIDFKASMNIDFKASMNLTGKADLAAKIEGSVSFTGKGGATAELNGAATCTVKGGMVMIN